MRIDQIEPDADFFRDLLPKLPDIGKAVEDRRQQVGDRVEVHRGGRHGDQITLSLPNDWVTRSGTKRGTNA